jgi:hypothetical protein
MTDVAGPLSDAALTSIVAMPRFWIWMQVVIVICVVASIVIAAIKM